MVENIDEIQNKFIVKTLLAKFRPVVPDELVDRVYERCNGNPWDAVLVDIQLLKEDLGLPDTSLIKQPGISSDPGSTDELVEEIESLDTI